jgi:hypothetical protein
VAPDVSCEHVLGDLPAQHLPSRDVEPVVQPSIYTRLTGRLDVRRESRPLIPERLSQYLGERGGDRSDHSDTTDDSASRSEC